MVAEQWNDLPVLLPCLGLQLHEQVEARARLSPTASGIAGLDEDGYAADPLPVRVDEPNLLKNSGEGREGTMNIANSDDALLGCARAQRSNGD